MDGNDASAAIGGRVIARGGLWRLAEAVGGEGTALLVFIVMSSILSPQDFGVVALAGVAIGCAQVLLQQGLPAAVIQGRTADEVRLATALWCNIGASAALMAVVFLLSYPAADLFGEPGLAPILMALTPALPITAAAAILQSKLVRRMAFRPTAIRALMGTSIGGLVGLGLAAAGAGVWALVGLQLASSITSLLVLFLADPWRPRLVFDFAEARAMLRFALPVTGTSVTIFAGRKLDVTLLGLWVSAASLGHYFLATRLIFALALATHYMIGSLTLAVLARLKDNPNALRTAAERALWFTGAICLPAGIGIALIADPLIRIFFGEAWTPAIAPLQVLAVSSILPALSLTGGQILVAAGKPRRVFQLTLANAGLSLAMVAVAAPFGVVAVAFAGSLAAALVLPAYVLALRDGIGLSPRIVLSGQSRIWAAAGIMAGCVIAFDSVVMQEHGSAVSAIAAIAVGVSAYSLALWILAGATIRTLLASLELGQGRSSARPGVSV